MVSKNNLSITAYLTLTRQKHWLELAPPPPPFRVGLQRTLKTHTVMNEAMDEFIKITLSFVFRFVSANELVNILNGTFVNPNSVYYVGWYEIM